MKTLLALAALAMPQDLEKKLDPFSREALQQADEFYPYHSLARDPERLQALADFYYLSSQPGTQNQAPPIPVDLYCLDMHQSHERTLVEDFSFKGTLIDDCGLILTADHGVARKIKSPLDWRITVTQLSGEHEAKITEIRDSLLDYVILAVETGKPPRTRPLHFPPRDNYLGQRIRILSQQDDGTGNFDWHCRGAIVPVNEFIRVYEDCLPNRRYANDFVPRKETLIPFAEAGGFLFTSALVFEGESGSSVLTKNGEFLGLVSHILPVDKRKNVRNCGPCVLTPAKAIQKGIEAFLETADIISLTARVR